MADLVFKTSLKEISVEIDGKDYALKELDGVQRGKYLNKMGSRIKLGPDGKISSFTDYSGLESTLLERCLYDSDNKLVPASVIETWPSSVLTSLFNVAQDLSGLNEEARKRQEAEAKNS